MSTGTKIQWTDTTWNPLRGCSAISPGCAHCYAARMCSRGLPGLLSPTTREPFAIHGKWTGRVELIESKLTEPLRWRKPRRVFVDSMSDLFHESLDVRDIYRVFGAIEAANMVARWHIYQCLTKRSKRMLAAMKEIYGPGNFGGPLPNVWLGVSVEDRARLFRIDDLRETPAAVRFISAEPLLEDLGELDLRGIDWVIVGCESGPGRRPFMADWARSVRDQCQAAGVAFFYKQGIVGGKVAELPELDGRQWAEFPKGGGE